MQTLTRQGAIKADLRLVIIAVAVAASVAAVPVLNRYQIAASPGGVWRLDKWTGKVSVCIDFDSPRYSAPPNCSAWGDAPLPAPQPVAYAPPPPVKAAPKPSVELLEEPPLPNVTPDKATLEVPPDLK